MPSEIKVYPAVLERLTADHIPPGVKDKVADKLEEIREDPEMGSYKDPVAGPTRIVKFEHDDILWRFAFSLARNDDGEIIGISAVAINPP